MALDPTAIIKPLSDAASSSVVGQTLSDAWQLVIGDRVAAWRLANAAKLQAKYNALIAERGMTPNIDRIPERFAITWFEEATKQDEDDIQDLFARLLANAVSGDEDALDRRNLEIVSKLTPNDAALFLELGEAKWGALRVGETLAWEERGRWFPPKDTKVVTEQVERSFEHLLTIGLLARLVTSQAELSSRSFGNRPNINTKIHYHIHFTETGKSVYRAVTGNPLNLRWQNPR